jgi:hypothetical protein
MNGDIETSALPVFDPDERYDISPKQSKKRSINFNDLKTRQIHERLLSWWTQAKEIEAVNRYQQAIDADFYDGLQWSEEDQETLMKRGQAPVVYNRIKPTIDWILGTEKRTRIDFNVLPRKKEHNKEAETKKERLKYINDVNKTVFSRSRAFADAVKVGVGWLEDSLRGDDEKELIQTKYESWRNIWYDPQSVERNLSDARFLFRSKFVDYDVALAMFPKAKFPLEQAVSVLFGTGSEQDADDDFFYATNFQQRDSQGNVLHRRSYANTAMVFNRRKRVKLIECWFRDPVSVKVLRGGDFSGQEYDDSNQGHLNAVQEEYSSLQDTLVMKMRVAIMTEGHILQIMDSPYAHNDFPFTPVWGYRRDRDNAPYGAIRNIRDPQEALNKRHSKALHILSSSQIIAHESATSDWDEVREEAAMPDGMIILDGTKDARFEVNTDKQLAQQHINLMQEDAMMIQHIGGVTDENMGRDTNATSGKAIEARQTQGSIVTAELFDNLRFAVQLQGEKQLSLVEQFDIAQQELRIAGNSGKIDYIPLNTPKFDEQSQSWVMLNPMTANQADFVVDKQDYQASMRAAMFETMTKMLQTLPPEVSLQLLDLVYENSDLPGRDEIVERIRKINGQQAPNVEMTPELMAQQQAKAAQEQKQAEQQDKAIELDLALKQAQINKTKADATKYNTETLYSGMQAGQLAVQIPGILPVSDSLLASAGFIDNNGSPLAIPTQSLPMQGVALPQNTSPLFPSKPSSPLNGINQGIETVASDGILQ